MSEFINIPTTVLVQRGAEEEIIDQQDTITVFFLIEVEFIYNIVSVSGVQYSDTT